MSSFVDTFPWQFFIFIDKTDFLKCQEVAAEFIIADVIKRHEWLRPK